MGFCRVQLRVMVSTEFFLTPSSIKLKIPAATYERGMGVYIMQQVLDYEVLFASASAWDIQGHVQGTERQPYWVVVAAEVDANGKLAHFEGDCTCPVGRNCKHAVALTLKAAYKSARPNVLKANPVPLVAGGPIFAPGSTKTKSTTSVAPTPRSLPDTLAELARVQAEQERTAQDRERKAAQAKVSQWLNLFGDTEPSDADDDPRNEAAKPTTHATDADVMVYGLSAVLRNGAMVLQLGFGHSRLLRNGTWAKVKAVRYVEAYRTPPQDMEIVRLIQTMASQARSYSYTSDDKCLLSGETGRLALQLADRSGRLFCLAGERKLGPTIHLGAARTLHWAWHEVTDLKAAEPSWALRGQLVEASAAPADPDTSTTSDDLFLTRATWYANAPPLYLDPIRGECGPIEVSGLSAEHLALLLKAPSIPQSAFALNEATLLRRLAGLPLPPVLKAPRQLKDIKPTALLHIVRVPLAQVPMDGLLSATLRFDYDGLIYYNRLMQSPVLLDRPTEPPEASERIMLHRDLVTEQNARAALFQLGLTGDAQGEFHLTFPGDFASLGNLQSRWLHWFENHFVEFEKAGFKVSIASDLADWIARADTLDVALGSPAASVPDDGGNQGIDSSTSPWFDLSLGMQINDQRHNILPFLPELLNQLGGLSQDDDGAAQFPDYVYLQQPDGTFLRLPTEPLRPWLQALLDLVGERGHDLSGDSLRLSRLEALRVGAALGQGVQWRGADRLREMVKQLGGHSALPEVLLPPGLHAELRPYQQQGLNWLQFLRTHGLAGILADDMGLGKTLQTLAHILVEKQAGRLDRPALVIAPVSLMGNWRREANRFTPDLKVLVLHGADRHEAAVDMAQHDLVVAPYSLLQRDRERWLQQPWHIVVLDEAQNIKNANSYAAQVVGELGTRHRLCLSGTPMENHLGELWSLFHFLMPGFLSSQARFKDLFRTPIEKLGNNERLEQLRKRVTPFMLRRAKADVATDLLPKQEFVSSVELGGKQADLYETIRLTTEKSVREALSNKGLARSQIQILDALLKLRQVCCDPRLVPLAAAKKIKQSAKLEMLMEMLPQMLSEGRRILLFSQFTSMLGLIEEELVKRSIQWVKLTGQSQKRDALIEQFTSGAVPLFLISLKAGGVGLNLPQADTVIHYDPWWNPAVENQATDRAHRIGQTQSVFVYKLVAQGTIEERILALQERKAVLANSLYSGAQGRKQPLFTEDDVAELLKPLSA